MKRVLICGDTNFVANFFDSILKQKDYEMLAEKVNVQTCEDIYHPYGMFCNFESLEEYYSHFSNMLVVTTGILPRSGGINPTAAVLPLVDEFIAHHFPLK